MKFSIVITTYNRLEFLKRAIACSLNQTMPCEVVVVDDASTDGTEAYGRSLGDQVVYCRNPQNLNHAGSVNVGVEAASGDWIKFLDDDDYLAENCIERLSTAIAQHPQAVICSCLAAQVDELRREIKQTSAIGPDPAFYIPQHAIHYGMLMDQAPLGTPVQVAVRRNAFLKTGGWDVTMTTNYDDIDSWIRIVEHGDAVFINECLAYRTVWAGSHERKMSLQNRMDLNITIKERIYKRVNERYRDRLPSLRAIVQYLHLHWGLVALKQKQLSTALSLITAGILSPQAWRLLIQARKLRLTRDHYSEIPKIALTRSGGARN